VLLAKNYYIKIPGRVSRLRNPEQRVRRGKFISKRWEIT
jgi:hypothetical protein